MLNYLDLTRQTYNTLLGLLNEQKEIDKAQIQGTIPDMKICDNRFKQLHSKSMQYECYKLFSNLQGLVQSKKNGRKVGRLRFKGKGWFKTFTYNQTGFKLIETGKRCQTLWLSKIGDIPIRCHRQVKGEIKQVTVKRYASGKWYASVITDCEYKIPQSSIKKVVGIDLGSTDVVWDSDNHHVGNPRHLKKKAKRLRRLQKHLSKTKKGSNNRHRARFKVAIQHEKTANARDDFVHKLSRYYVDNYDAIGFEDMDIHNLVKGNWLAKNLLDASCGKLRQYTYYKAEKAGKMCVFVEARGTTQRCSQCQREVPKSLGDRIHKCPYCGFFVPRDYNSAWEIKRLTLIKIGLERPESKHWEMEALPVMATSICEK